MDGGVVALVLTSFAEKNRLLLVRSTDAIRLCRDGAETLARQRAIDYLTGQLPLGRTQVCTFILESRLGPLPLARLEDYQLLAYLREELKAGNLQVIRVSEHGPEGKDSALVQQRRLIRSIERELPHGLSHQGRRYRLVAGDDLRRMPNRDQYEVVNRDDATSVLAGFAARSESAFAKLLAEVRDQLTRDWKPPRDPDGLVMLRAIVQLQSADRPAMVEPRSARTRAPVDTPAEQEAPANEPEVDDPCQVSALVAASADGVPFCRDYSSQPDTPARLASPVLDEPEEDDSCQASALIAASGDGVPFCRDYQV